MSAYCPRPSSEDIFDCLGDNKNLEEHTLDRYGNALTFLKEHCVVSHDVVVDNFFFVVLHCIFSCRCVPKRRCCHWVQRQPIRCLVNQEEAISNRMSLRSHPLCIGGSPTLTHFDPLSLCVRSENVLATGTNSPSPLSRFWWCDLLRMLQLSCHRSSRSTSWFIAHRKQVSEAFRAYIHDNHPVPGEL